jgi:uncharacterized membrane protein
MTFAHIASTPGSTPRWLLFASLALNLFFAGIAGALIVRHYTAAPAATTSVGERGDAARIEYLASLLPPADGTILRNHFAARRAAIEAARSNYRAKQETIRQALREETLNAGAMRTAMAETRAARQNFDQILHGVIAGAASEMSPAGRRKLADWRSAPRQ